MHLHVCLLLVCGVLVSANYQYLDEWAVTISEGDDVAELVARANHLKIARKIHSLENVYVFKRNEDLEDTESRQKRSFSNVERSLLSDPNVLFVEQQRLLKREKRGAIPLHLEKRHIVHNKALDLGITDEEYTALNKKREEYEATNKKRTVVDMGIKFDDPEFHKQWYLINRGQNGGFEGNDINVLPAWKAGYTGRGVTVLVLDDGIDHENDDLKTNYRADISADFNNRSSDGEIIDHDPRPDDTNPDNSHGTRCAGEIAASANNSFCVVGVAYNAGIGGIRILDGSVTDTLEAEALTYMMDKVDIYSASWGPPDSGKVMEGPGRHCKQALRTAAEQGRGGKGNIFSWATGNGGQRNDTCSCDGYVGSIYTISIGSLTVEGSASYFTEVCPSTMGVVYTGGSHAIGQQSGHDIGVVTTDLHSGCMSGFQGTSAAAPLAAGCFALVLEANMELTYRDMMYLIVKTAKISFNDAESGGTWSNGAGNHYHPHYGFGVLDCSAMVSRSLDWQTVPPLRNVTINSTDTDIAIPGGGCIEREIQVSAQALQQLEHVDLQIAVDTADQPRGDIVINLISSDGTNSRMLEHRSADPTHNIHFTFNTVLNWGEDPEGTWTLKVCSVKEATPATLTRWGLTFYGIEGRSVPNSQPSERNVNNDKHGSTSHVMSHGEVNNLMKIENEDRSSLIISKNRNLDEQELREAIEVLSRMLENVEQSQHEKVIDAYLEEMERRKNEKEHTVEIKHELDPGFNKLSSQKSRKNAFPAASPQVSYYRKRGYKDKRNFNHGIY